MSWQLQLSWFYLLRQPSDIVSDLYCGAVPALVELLPFVRLGNFGICNLRIALRKVLRFSQESARRANFEPRACLAWFC